MLLPNSALHDLLAHPIVSVHVVLSLVSVKVGSLSVYNTKVKKRLGQSPGRCTVGVG